MFRVEIRKVDQPTQELTFGDEVPVTEADIKLIARCLAHANEVTGVRVWDETDNAGRTIYGWGELA